MVQACGWHDTHFYPLQRQVLLRLWPYPSRFPSVSLGFPFLVFPVLPYLSMFLFVCVSVGMVLPYSFSWFPAQPLQHTYLKSAHHLTHLFTCLHFLISHSIYRSIHRSPFPLFFVSSSVLPCASVCHVLCVSAFLKLPVCLPVLAS